ncbi:hypothetical protein RCO27_11445 [Sphingosinicella sp. LHD-64]|uniref:hypothetical protein n=1 Tax=Sphingosinicella sp. LHD-64 TaxID=3072139 RepID=UPI00280DBB7E|nr:hypothetical protein [Sphingosinicella sp. LHD-64]MDQ8756841.1 hypothetical protein [Sphingosinicella sp. LHD-64]
MRLPTGRRTGLCLLPLLAAAAGGCAVPGRPMATVVAAAPEPDWDQLLRSAADQVRRCYRGPRVGHAGRQIVTRLRIFLTAEGMLEGMPTVVAQEGVTPANRLYAPRMAEAAIRSVMRCAPLRLPAGLAGNGTFEIDLTFSPLAAV